MKRAAKKRTPAPVRAAQLWRVNLYDATSGSVAVEMNVLAMSALRAGEKGIVHAKRLGYGDVRLHSITRSVIVDVF